MTRFFKKVKVVLCRSVVLLVCPLMLSQYALADTSTHTGNATFYGYGGGGNCSFPKSDILTAAMNTKDYDGSAACGGVIEVTSLNTGKKVLVRIDDQCPNCDEGHVDLDQKAFAKIDDISKGIIPITWRYVANDNAGTMKLYFKEGSSQWWTAIQVRDHKYPISKLEYRVSGQANYIALPREPYNYFVANSGFGVGPYDFRITDFFGQTVEVSRVPLTVTTPIDTGKQFL